MGAAQSDPNPPASGAPEPADAQPPPWQYGFFVDGGYALNFNHPQNHLFRNRGTTPRVDEVDLNMAGIYLKKDVSPRSRWGMQLTVHAGEDSKVFGFSATAPNLPGANALRHLGPTNVSYLAPVGKGLTLQGGIFNSFIGYDSLYAKDNFNYTRPWGADYTPYLMLGINASYPVTGKLTISGFLVNGYWHLANANHVPSFGGQAAYKPNNRWTIKQAFLVGPHQSDTSLKFWRFLSDSIVEWKREPFTVAAEYIAATENVAAPRQPRATWMAVQLPARWAIDKHWSVTVRPEVAWDSDGRWTLSQQTIKAVTTTVAYRFPCRRTATIVRLEHRYDDSRGGPTAGFYRGRETASRVVPLVPGQHLLIFGISFAFDAQTRH